MKNNIAIYGGSFNPPTLAHSRVVSWVFETWNKIDRIILLPSWIRQDKDFWIKKEQRRILLEEFHNDLLEQNLPVEIDNYFFEWKNWEDTTTVQEDTYFKEIRWIHPEFIYWSDVITRMPIREWNVDKYIEHVLSKIFVHRPGYKVINPDDYDMKSYRFIEIPDIPNVSSTIAKEKLLASESVEWILNPKITQLIIENQLYNTGK